MTPSHAQDTMIYATRYEFLGAIQNSVLHKRQCAKHSII